MPFTLDYAKTMAAEVAPSSLLVMKQQLYRDLAGDLDTAARASVDHMQRMVKEPDFAEGVAAFQARRPANFKPPSP